MRSGICPRRQASQVGVLGPAVLVGCVILAGGAVLAFSVVLLSLGSGGGGKVVFPALPQQSCRPGGAWRVAAGGVVAWVFVRCGGRGGSDPRPPPRCAPIAAVRCEWRLGGTLLLAQGGGGRRRRSVSSGGSWSWFWSLSAGGSLSRGWSLPTGRFLSRAWLFCPVVLSPERRGWGVGDVPPPPPAERQVRWSVAGFDRACGGERRGVAGPRLGKGGRGGVPPPFPNVRQLRR